MESKKTQMSKNLKKFLRTILMVCFLLMSICPPRPVSAQGFNCSQGKHDYAVTTKAATESEDGETIYTCRICGFSFSRVLPATGHSWGPWVVDRQPSCGIPGHRYRICTRHINDPHRQEESIPALDHLYVEEAVPATCTQEGYKRYSCQRCGNHYTEPSAPAGHRYVETIVREADCVQAGERIMTCEVCGDTYTETFGELTEHQYIEEIVKKPECEEAGEKQFSCEICGDTYTEKMKALGHSYGKWITDKEATADEEGRRYRVCSHDEAHIVEEAIPQLSSAEQPPEEEQPPDQKHIDIILLSSIAAMSVGFGIAIYRDLSILHWERKRSMTYYEWLNDRHS